MNCNSIFSNHKPGPWKEESYFSGEIIVDEEGLIHRAKWYEKVAYCVKCGQKLSIDDGYIRRENVPTKTRIVL